MTLTHSTTPTLRRLRLLVLSLTVAALSACSQSPTAVYVNMTTAAQMGDRDGFLGGFSERSRDLVEALISLSEAYGMTDSNPYELLVFDSVEDETIDGDRAILQVRTRGKTRKILLIQDDGEWRIDTQELEAFWLEEGRG